MWIFYDTRIAAIGIAQSFCYECPRPEEFGTAGLNWSAVGWKVDVRFLELNNRIRPKDHMVTPHWRVAGEVFAAPSQRQRTQNVYLTEVGTGFAAALFRLIGAEANVARDAAAAWGSR